MGCRWRRRLVNPSIEVLSSGGGSGGVKDGLGVLASSGLQADREASAGVGRRKVGFKVRRWVDVEEEDGEDAVTMPKVYRRRVVERPLQETTSEQLPQEVINAGTIDESQTPEPAVVVEHTDPALEIAAASAAAEEGENADIGMEDVVEDAAQGESKVQEVVGEGLAGEGGVGQEEVREVGEAATLEVIPPPPQPTEPRADAPEHE
ncbi:hypothetical protein PYCC9005_005747 [Savitreella phatthalungensis]